MNIVEKYCTELKSVEEAEPTPYMRNIYKYNIIYKL